MKKISLAVLSVLFVCLVGGLSYLYMDARERTLRDNEVIARVKSEIKNLDLTILDKKEQETFIFTTNIEADIKDFAFFNTSGPAGFSTYNEIKVAAKIKSAVEDVTEITKNFRLDEYSSIIPEIYVSLQDYSVETAYQVLNMYYAGKLIYMDNEEGDVYDDLFHLIMAEIFASMDNSVEVIQEVAFTSIQNVFLTASNKNKNNARFYTSYSPYKKHKNEKEKAIRKTEKFADISNTVLEMRLDPNKVISAMLKEAILNNVKTYRQSGGNGLLGDGLRWLGDRTGVKPIHEIGDVLDEISHGLKKSIPIYGDADEAVSRTFRETGKWIEENPEKALYFAAFIATGVYVCWSGCTVLVGLQTSGGGFIALTQIDFKDDDEEDEPVYTEPSSRTSDEGDSDDDEDVKVKSESSKEDSTDEEIERYFDKRKYPGGPADLPRTVRYKLLNERDVAVIDEFAYPSPFKQMPVRPISSFYDIYDEIGHDKENPDMNPQIRMPSETDPAGGVFTSPRSSLNYQPAISKWREKARRIHAGTDVPLPENADVPSNATGTVIKIGQWKHSIDGKNYAFDVLYIKHPSGGISTLAYVKPNPNIKEGSKVIAGVTIVGRADRLSRSPRYKNTPNHVHSHHEDRFGRRFDPWTNTVVAPILRPRGDEEK